MNWKKIILILIIFIFFIIYYGFDLNKYLDLNYIQNSKEIFENYYYENQVKTILLFSIAYILSTSLSFPGATVLTILSGYLFGLFLGTIIVSISSTIGATIAMLISRFIFRDYFKSKFKKIYDKVNIGIKKEGNFYLFSLRVAPIFPFVLVNSLMGLTNIKTIRYALISLIGMLPGTIIYVNAGLQLSKINSVSEIFSLNLIFSFLLVGLFPLISKQIIKIYKTSKTRINTINIEK